MYLFNLKIFVCSNSTLASSSLSHVSRLALQWTQVAYIKRVKNFHFVVCLHIHPLAGDTMNSKFFIMNSAFASFIIHISCSLCRQRVDVYVNKPLTYTCRYEPLNIGWARITNRLIISSCMLLEFIVVAKKFS